MVQFPTRPISDYTAAAQRSAEESTYTGTLRAAADLWRAAITKDGYFAGLMSTITDGILGLPLNLQGDPGMVAALQDAEGTAGEYSAMFPRNEARAVMADGIGFGVGLGQLLEPTSPMQRPVGGHRVLRLKWWDPRDLRQNPYTRQWFLLTRSGEIEIHPGDGEWILYTPYPQQDAWRHGPWIYLTLGFVFSRDAKFDRQRHSEVLAPTRVARAQKPTRKEARKDFLAGLNRMLRDNCLVLPEQWIYEIVESSGTAKITDVYKDIIEAAHKEAEVGLTGNAQMVEGPAGFANADIYRRVSDSKRRFFAETWFDCIREQALCFWALDNYGTRNAPTGGYNVESPEDAVARAKVFTEIGNGFKNLQAGCAAAGCELDPQWTIEVLQRSGIRAKMKGSAAPAPQAPPSPDPLPDPAVTPEAAAEGMTGEDVAALAEKMTAHGIERCEHGSLNRCRLCGIERVRDFLPGENGGEHTWQIKWRPIPPEAL